MNLQHPSPDDSASNQEAPGSPSAPEGTPPPATAQPGAYPTGPYTPVPGAYPGYAGPGSAPAAPYPGGYAPPPGGMPGGYPSGPYAPGGYPTYPNYPTYPGGQYPPTLPAHPMAPYAVGMPGYPPAPKGPPHPWNPAAWGKGPIPLPLVVLFFLLGIALTALVAAGTIGVARQDWAAGSVAAGVVALLLAAVYLVVTAVRVGLGRRTLSTILLGLAAVVIFAGGGVAGLGLRQSLHLSQAKALETSGNWTGALNEYALAGEHAPGSHNLARVHDEWGEALEQQGQYTAAISQFSAVIAGFAGATAEVARAQNDDARAHFEYGTQLATQGDAQGAIAAFDYIAAHYGSSTYASRAHAAAAKTYLALGKSQIAANSCPDAISSYRTLSAKYGDTAEGKQAKSALAAPVDVKGQLTHYPTNPAPTMYFSRSATGSAGQYNFSAEYTASLGAGGNFTFHNVKQGAYNLAALLPDGSGVYWQSNGNLFDNVVGPLCTFDLGARNFSG